MSRLSASLLKFPFIAGLFVSVATGFCFARNSTDNLLAARGARNGAYTVVSGTMQTTFGLRIPKSEEAISPKSFPQATAAALSANMSDLVLAETENGITVYKTDTGLKSHTIDPLALGIKAVRLSPGDWLLASGENNGTIKFWRFMDGEFLAEAAKLEAAPVAIEFSQYGNYAAFLSKKGELAMFDFRKQRLLWTKTLDFPAASIMFSPDEKRILIGSQGWLASVSIDGLTVQPQYMKIPLDSLITALGFDPT
ncbi:MAG: WD40 repeat domain-containing protein, partial [Elusimicrobiaceae bacterium]|nr:WD40 repeat domain-containing protein [Elusimicrobiaceae bacterium]